MNYKYPLILMVGISVGFFVQDVHAVTTYCNREFLISLFNNNLEYLIDCVNLPDIQQDLKIEQNSVKIQELDQRTKSLDATVIK